MIVKVIRVQPRCTPEAFEQVQIGMYLEDVFAIDPNPDLDPGGASFPLVSWHWLSDDTFVRIEYKPTDSGYKIAAIEYFSNFEEILEHGVGGSNFRWLNPADLPD